MEALKTRLLALLGALAVIGWGLFLWKVRNPSPPVEKLVTQIEYRDRVVNKIIEQVKTLPGGTTIRTVIREQSKEVAHQSTSVSTKPKLDKYSLGLGVRAQITNPLAAPAYSVQFGRRLWESPLWVTVGLEYQQRSTNVLADSSALVGLSWHW